MERAEKSASDAASRSTPPHRARRAEGRGDRGPARASSKTRSEQATLEALREHTVAHLDDDLTLAAFARRAGMSASCFSRWFRDQTGMTPHAFVLEARVARAKALLRQSDLPLIDVALAVGFSSQSCLNVTFRRRAAMTPAEYRAEFSKKAKDGRHRSVRRSSSLENATRARTAPDRRGAKSQGEIE